MNQQKKKIKPELSDWISLMTHSMN